MIRHLAPLLLALLSIPLCSSCVAVAAAGMVGVGVVQYQRNELEKDFPTALDATWQACLQAVKEQGIVDFESELGVTEADLQGQDLFLRAEVHPEGFTRVRLRFGSFYTADHQRRAELLLQGIERALQQGHELRDWTEKVRKLSRPRQGAEPKP